MSPRWESIARPPVSPAPLLFDAVITPHRSMSGAGLRIVLGAFLALNVAAAALFLARGAWPVVGFLGLDVALLAWAFFANLRSARVCERVRIAPEFLHVACEPERGPSRHWVVAPAWARVVDQDPAVRIRAGDRSVTVGAFLSEEERAGLARAIRDAIRASQNPSTARMS